MKKKQYQYFRLLQSQTIKGQEMKQLERTKKVAIYKNINESDSIGYAIGIIQKHSQEIPKHNHIIRWETFVPFDSNRIRVGWILDDYKSAMTLYRKLVRKHG